MRSWRLPPTFIPGMPSSHPLITSPAPRRRSQGLPPTELSNFLPFVSQPVSWTFTRWPVRASGPVPCVMFQYCRPEGALVPSPVTLVGPAAAAGFAAGFVVAPPWARTCVHGKASSTNAIVSFLMCFAPRLILLDRGRGFRNKAQSFFSGNDSFLLPCGGGNAGSCCSASSGSDGSAFPATRDTANQRAQGCSATDFGD